MKNTMIHIKKALVGIMVLAMTASLIPPVPAAAAESNTQTESDNASTGRSNVRVDNHTTDRDDAMAVSELIISDVLAPEAGKRLDDTALVTTAEDEQWQIPVLWVSDELRLASGIAEEKRTYLPILAFVVPDGYTVENSEGSDGGFMIGISEDVMKLFGNSPIISIYEKGTGITYILPASLKDLFADKGQNTVDYDYYADESEVRDGSSGTEDEATDTSAEEDDGKKDDQGEDKQEDQQEDQQEEEKDDRKEDGDDEQEEQDQTDDSETEDEQEETSGLEELVNVHCSDAAKEAFSEEDLEFLTDLIVNKLQPQAVNLLVESFPAFKEAAEKGQLGKYLGLVIDYDPGSQTYATANPGRTGSKNQFCYKMWINANTLAERSSDGQLTIARSGKSIIELANTVVHEMLHIFMYDYNRVGLVGYIDPSDKVFDSDGNLTEKARKIMYPQWFIEGTASAVEHNWRGRPYEFGILKTDDNGKSQEKYSAETVLTRYLKGLTTQTDDGSLVSPLNFDLECATGVDKNGKSVDTIGNRYVTGYLATLYLSELAANYNSDTIGSSVTTKDGYTSFNSRNLCLGLNYILKEMHEGATLDQVISRISGGRFKDSADFEARFIKGTQTDGTYTGDTETLSFAVNFMNYMQDITNTEGRENVANGSVLFDFEQDFTIPLDPDKYDTADIFKVIDWSGYVLSSVSEDVAYSTGGKSVSGSSSSDTASADDQTDVNNSTAATASEETAEDDLAAAKTDTDDSVGTDTSSEDEISGSGETAVSDEAAASEETGASDEISSENATTPDGTESSETITSGETSENTDDETSDTAGDEDSENSAAGTTAAGSSSTDSSSTDDASDSIPAGIPASGTDAEDTAAGSNQSDPSTITESEDASADTDSEGAVSNDASNGVINSVSALGGTASVAD